MTAPDTPSREELRLADIEAGNAFRDTLVPRADRGDGFSPAWSGWALMESFLAGAAYARLAAKPADDGVRELIRTATRMRDMLTVDADPPFVDVPNGCDPMEFTTAFDELASAICALSTKAKP